MLSPEMIAEARSVPIAEAVAAYTSDLRRQGLDLVGSCPVCGGHDRFAVHTRRNVFNCRECEKGGDPIALVRHVEGVGFVQAVGLLLGGVSAPPSRPQREGVVRASLSEEDGDRRRQTARRRFGEGRAELGLAGIYLQQARKLAGFDDLAGPVLRFHPRLPWRQDDGELTTVPALMSAMTDIVTGEVSAIIRVALTPEGRKIARKTSGVARGAAVRLDRLGEDLTVLTVAEGVETGIAARMLGLPRVWAVGGTAGIANLPVISGVQRLNLCEENDENGASARAVTACGTRWRDAGRDVTVIRPPAGCSDLNDILIRRAAR